MLSIRKEIVVVYSDLHLKCLLIQVKLSNLKRVTATLIIQSEIRKPVAKCVTRDQLQVYYIFILVSAWNFHAAC
jgi:hypothetical protein